MSLPSHHLLPNINSACLCRFWVLEVVARMPYFAYISMLHLYESLGWWRAGAELRKVRPWLILQPPRSCRHCQASGQEADNAAADGAVQFFLAPFAAWPHGLTAWAPAGGMKQLRLPAMSIVHLL